MMALFRVLIILGCILSIAAAGASFSIYQSYHSERDIRLEAETKLMQVQDAASALRADMDQQRSRIVDLEGQVDILKESEKGLKTKHLAKDAELVNLKNDLALKSDELLRLQAQIEDYRKKERVLTPLIKAPMEPTSLLTSGAQAPGLTPTAGATTTTSTSITAPLPETKSVIPSEAPISDDSRVLTVNRKFNFVVLNLGLRDGLRMGDKVSVMQGTTPKALTQIEKIYDKFSAATLLNEDKGNPVREGDSIRKV